MSVIDERARRIVGGGLIQEVEREQQLDSEVDETGTTAAIPSAAEERYLTANFSLQELEEVQKVDDYLLQVHGLPPTRKQDNVVRLLYENVNGLNNRISGNKKLERCKEMFDELEVDIVAMN